MNVSQSESKSFVRRLCSALAVLLLTVSVSALAQDAAPNHDPVPDASPETDPVAIEDAAQKAAPEESGTSGRGKPTGKLMLDEDEMSPGMHLAFDGSSTQAFEKSMADIQSQTTDAEFVTVQHAINYLLLYDLAARGNPEALYQRLDGKTPADMLKTVNWQTGKRAKRNR